MTKNYATTSAVRFYRTPRFGFTELFSVLIAWQDRWRQRQILAELDDRMLKDIGIGRSSAEREYSKPFWRAH